jgi:hypothetical protein
MLAQTENCCPRIRGSRCWPSIPRRFTAAGIIRYGVVISREKSGKVLYYQLGGIEGFSSRHPALSRRASLYRRTLQLKQLQALGFGRSYCIGSFRSACSRSLVFCQCVCGRFDLIHIRAMASASQHALDSALERKKPRSRTGASDEQMMWRLVCACEEVLAVAEIVYVPEHGRSRGQILRDREQRIKDVLPLWRVVNQVAALEVPVA